MIRNIILDFGNVLVKWNPNQLIELVAKEEKKKELLKQIVFHSGEWEKLDIGKHNREEAIIEYKKIAPWYLHEKIERFMILWYKQLPVNEEMVGLIKTLKENGYGMYALSNTHMDFYEYLSKTVVGSFFDGYVISAQEHLLKPDIAIYHRLFEKFSVLPEECFFIDDSQENIEAAKACGMQGHQFEWNNFDKLKQSLQEKDIKI